MAMNIGKHGKSLFNSAVIIYGTIAGIILNTLGTSAAAAEHKGQDKKFSSNYMNVYINFKGNIIKAEHGNYSIADEKKSIISASTEEKEKLILAKKLIKILGYEKNYRQRVDRAIALTYQDMKQKYVRNPKMLPVLRDVLAEVRQDMLKRKQEFFELMAREYAKGMDKDVMAAAIEFYSSPQGQAFIKQNKMVRQRAKAASRKWVKSMMKRAIQDVFRKARERGVPL